MIDCEIVAAAKAAFAQSYFDARSRFTSACAGHVEYVSDAVGPAGEALGTDTCWLGAHDARKVLVLVSGVHGAEGFAGAALQTDLLLQRNRFSLEADEAILLVHGLNCHGFAWDRRVTEEGCDLNRNFIDFAAPLPRNDDYVELANYLVPHAFDPDSLAEAEVFIEEWRLRHGERAFQIARKSGQYVDRHGMFYGGTAPSAARLRLEAIAGDYDLANREWVTVIDVHTGLGPYGYAEVQSEHDLESEAHAFAMRIFGDALTSVEAGTSFSVPVAGTALNFWQNLRGDGRFLYLCVEFGTFDQETSRHLYRRDHWIHKQDPGLVATFVQQHKTELRRFFYPNTPAWNEMVLARGRQIVRQALAALR